MRPALLAALLLLCSAGIARAATVDAGEPFVPVVLDEMSAHGYVPERTIVFNAEPGERNAVLVQGHYPYVFISDRGAHQLTASGYGCEPAGVRRVRCRFSDDDERADFASNLEIHTHAGNDHVVVARTAPAELFPTVDSGTGRDRISTAGEAGVRAGPGDDRVAVFGLEDGSDIDCGAGRDRYRGYAVDVRHCERRRILR